MKKTVSLWVVFTVSAGAAAGQEQSLAETARKERERRAAQAKEAKPAGSATRVVTQEDLDAYAAGRPADSETKGSPGPTEPSAPGSAVSPQGIPDDSDARAQLEKSWRSRAEAAQAAVKAAEQEVETAQDERDLLGTGPLVGGRVIDGRRGRRLGGENPAEWTQKADAADARLARAKMGLEQARKSLESFEEEARRAGIPPGWLR